MHSIVSAMYSIIGVADAFTSMVQRISNHRNFSFVNRYMVCVSENRFASTLTKFVFSHTAVHVKNPE